MEMEFLEEETRPRFVFQSRPQPSSSPETKSPQTNSKTLLFFTLPVACVFLSLSFVSVEAEPFKSLLIWLSLSLLIGPFAPASITGGDIRVGQGPIIPDPIDSDAQSEPEPKKKLSQKRSKAENSYERRENGVSVRDFEFGNENPKMERITETTDVGSSLSLRNGGEEGWTEEDVEILKKQMGKHPVGKPGRWEAIAGAFNGRHKVESVISKSKELGSKKVDDADSYALFLKNRKLDERINGGNQEGNQMMDKREIQKDNGGDDVGTSWTSGEDIALLNAMKAFSKDSAMRWEKIAAAVPGKSKAACMKRATELKKEFRSSKASKEG